MVFPSNSDRQIFFDSYALDLETGELKRNGTTVLRLQDKPFQVLVALLERPGLLVSREQLRERLWGSDTFVDFEVGLNKAVNRLREALSDFADEPRLIETLPRKGYRFVGVIERPRSDAAA